ncbi:MAG TPA: hypothetical protein VN697_16000 [Tepidiformaceae bacterium]|nr:hypothetical protein [Tepidiformaceae bacterium]
MKVTLRDERGMGLTEVNWHAGRVPGQILVDRLTRPVALFEYYFDGGRRCVIVAIGTTLWSATLGTCWRMGARCWFLDDFQLTAGASRGEGALATVEAAPVDTGGHALQAEHDNSAQRSPATARRPRLRGAAA